MSLSIITLDLLHIADTLHFPDSDDELNRFLFALGHANERVWKELLERQQHRTEAGKSDAHII